MNSHITEMEAIPISEPEMVTLLDPNSLEEVEHYGYLAELLLMN